MTPELDPFRALEDAALRQQTEGRAERCMDVAKSHLILGKGLRKTTTVFFGSLIWRLDLQVEWGLGTMATDGENIFYDPGFVVNLPPQHLMGVLAHEVLHNVLKHHTRREGRDPQQWNIACDLAINPLLTEAGFQLPSTALKPGYAPYDQFPSGESADFYYARIQQDQPPPPPPPQQGDQQQEGQGEGQGQGEGEGEGEGEGQGNPDPGGCGAVRDPQDSSEATAKQSEANWSVAVAQAAQAAQSVGQLSAGLARLVQEVLAPKVDWKAVLREFVTRYARSDYSMSPPNRRFVWQGLYLPGMRSEELGELVVAIDTSGSVDDAMLQLFGSEVQGILDSYDCELTILYADCHVCHVDTWRSSDGPLKLEHHGGGGTDHAPVFEWILKNKPDTTCVVCLTDLYTNFPADPGIPTLWTVVGGNASEPPFGQRVTVD